MTRRRDRQGDFWAVADFRLEATSPEAGDGYEARQGPIGDGSYGQCGRGHSIGSVAPLSAESVAT